MFSVTIFAVGKLKEPWLREGFSEYRKRLSAYCDLSVVEIPEHRLPEAPSPAAAAVPVPVSHTRVQFLRHS